MKWKRRILGFFWHSPFAPAAPHKKRPKHKTRHKRHQRTAAQSKKSPSLVASQQKSSIRPTSSLKLQIRKKGSLQSSQSTQEKRTTRKPPTNPSNLVTAQTPIIELHKNRNKELCTFYKYPNRCVIFKLCCVETCHSYQPRSKKSPSSSLESNKSSTTSKMPILPTKSNRNIPHRRKRGFEKKQVPKDTTSNSNSFSLTQAELSILHLYSHNFATVKFVTPFPKGVLTFDTLLDKMPHTFIQIESTYIAKITDSKWITLKHHNGVYLYETQFKNLRVLLKYLLSQKLSDKINI